MRAFGVVAAIMTAIVLCITAAVLLMKPTLQGNGVRQRRYLSIVGHHLEKSALSSAYLGFSSENDFESWCNSRITGDDRDSKTARVVVPMPIVRNLQGPAGTEPTDQLLVFILDKHPKLVKRLYPSDCRSIVYVLGEGPFCKDILPGYAKRGAGERDTDKFLAAADAMWVAAAHHDKEAFNRARSSFGASDVFVGSKSDYDISKRVLRLSGRQLDAMASLLAKDVFGEKPAQPAAKASH